MLLGGRADLTEEFPERPKGMHNKRYACLKTQAKASEKIYNSQLKRWLNL